MNLLSDVDYKCVLLFALQGGGNIVSNLSNLTKSYSLSDLRDTETRKSDQVDGLVVLKPQQTKVVLRPKKAGSISTRSSSTQRPSSLIYFPEMEDVKESPRTAQNDYK